MKPSTYPPGWNNMPHAKENEYEAKIRCSNFGKYFEVLIPKGIAIQDYIDDRPCEYCGCYTLKKTRQ